MRLLKKTGEAFLLAGIFFLAFLIFFEDRIRLPVWVQVVGRMHPMFLHFPITLLLVYFVIFWIPVQRSSTWVKVIGLIAACSAVITAIMGLLLSLQETHEGNTFIRHKWGGVSIALLAFSFYYLHSFFIRKKSLGRSLTVLSAALILFTGHWGGNLTHGENYLLEPFAKEKRNVPLNQARAFIDIVQPIFQSRCGTCHSDADRKGGLSLSDTTAILQGGKTGPFFLAGDPANSLFLQRLLLPAGNKKHMAPLSKPQLTDEEFQLLYSWVKAGAPLDKKIIELPEKDSFRLLASRSILPSGSIPEQTTYNFPAADEKIIRSLNNNYRSVTPLGLHSAALEVQFYGRKAYTAKSLEELLSVKQQIIELGLAGMPLKNDDLKTIGQMMNLQKLNINYTPVSDEGILNIIKLKKLREIALSGTAVSAMSLEKLIKIPSLKTIFIWNTSVDSNKISYLQNHYKKIKIETGYSDNGQALLPLNPPVTQAVPGVYGSSVVVKLTHPMKGVEIRYTLDESEPDSIRSRLYKEPLELTTFTVVKARAFKKKWYGSKPLKAVYFMQGLKPDSISIVSDQPENRGSGKILFDLETGDLNVGSGKWLDLKKTTSCYVFFNTPVRVHKLMMNMFTDIKNKMFLPAKMVVRGGMDKNNMKLLQTWKSGAPPKKGDPDLVQPAIEFAETKLRCIELIIDPLLIKKEDPHSFISEVVLQ